MTPHQYTKAEILAGRHPMICIEAGVFGDFYLRDGDWRALAGKSYASRDAAERARSNAIVYGCKFIGTAP